MKTLSALDSLMKLYASKALALIFEEVFVTEHILTKHSAVEVKLTVDISRTDYEECRESLRDSPGDMRCDSVDSDSATSSYTPESSDVTGNFSLRCHG